MNNTIRKYTGAFEAHITIESLPDAATKERFMAFCEKNALKGIEIELSRGDFMHQPMTCSLHEGDFQEVLGNVQHIAQNLAAEGFPVTRVKLEAAPFNAELPQTNAEVVQHAPSNYFEHHLKLLLPAEADTDLLLQICEKYHAHLSRNAFKKLQDGMSERFVTIRNYGLGKAEAEQSLCDLRNAIEAVGFQVIKSITEYCVYDDCLDLDANWLEVSSPCEKCDSVCMMANPA